MRAWIGKTIIAIGIFHTVFGLIFGSTTLFILINERLFNTVNGQPEREAFFWFLYSGFLLMMLGGLIDHFENQNIPIPQLFIWSFTIISVVGMVIMPLSGFWLLLIPLIGLFIYRKSASNKRI